MPGFACTSRIFPERWARDEMPAGILQVSLRDPLAARPGFSFENVEVAAYPFAARAARPPCQLVLQTWEAPEKTLVLDAAGQERLRRKADRLARRWDEVGPEQTLYEEVMSGLGYQHNKASFRHLAETVPLAAVRALAGQPLEAQALLLGVSGLLPETLASRWDEETCTRVRALWNAWWKQRDAWSRRLLPRSAWRMQGRPANHPVRRLAAAAVLFSAPAGLSFASERAASAQAVPRAERALQAVSDPYWDHRVTWGGMRLKQPLALVGADRARALAINVIVPFLAAAGRSDALPADILAGLPRETSNSLVRQTAHNLFGSHHPGSLYATGLRRQGLLQIFHDYCLNDRSRCASCSFPALLAAWRSS
jgi:hypothetical protein